MQEVIVQNFLAKPGTAMHDHPSCDRDEYLRTHRRRPAPVLPPAVHLQAPPNLSDDLGRLLAAGIDDWGGVSPLTPDHVNPERPWPALERLRRATEAAGKVLAPRLTVYPEYVHDPARWLDEQVRPAVLHASDAEGLARDDGWASGGDAAPPELLDRAAPADAPRPDRARCSTASSPARSPVSTSSSPCSRPAARRWPRSRRSPTRCGGRRSATR